MRSEQVAGSTRISATSIEYFTITIIFTGASPNLSSKSRVESHQPSHRPATEEPSARELEVDELSAKHRGPDDTEKPTSVVGSARVAMVEPARLNDEGVIGGE